MTRVFVTVVLLLAAGVTAVCIHYATFSKESGLPMLTAATDIVSPSLGVSYYEPRILLFEKASNPAYPAMPSINRLDYVYAK